MSAVWHHNRAVRVVCAVLILAMLGELLQPPAFPPINVIHNINTALGIFSFTLGCHPGGLSYSNGIFAPTSDPASLRTVYEGILVGVTSCVLSLSTNLVATLLVGYKAWYVVDIRVKCDVLPQSNSPFVQGVEETSQRVPGSRLSGGESPSAFVRIWRGILCHLGELRSFRGHSNRNGPSAAEQT